MVPRFVPLFAPVCTVLVIGLCAANAARADTESELVRARSQFDQALSLEVAGDFGGALAKLEEVSRVRLTPQVRFHMGRCKEQLGRLTEALGDYRLAEQGDIQIRPEDLERIRLARQDLEARVPRLLLVVGSAGGSVRVELDGVEIGVARLQEPLLVNPGPRRVVVRGRDGVRLDRTVVAVERQIQRVELGTKGVSPRNWQGAGPSGAVVRGNADTPLWPYVVGGVGVVAIVGAGVCYYVRQDARQTLDKECIDGVCPERLRSVQLRGERASTALPLALVAGILGLGIGGYGLLAPEHSTERRAAVTSRWSVQVGTQFLGADFVGPF